MKKMLLIVAHNIPELGVKFTNALNSCSWQRQKNFKFTFNKTINQAFSNIDNFQLIPFFHHISN